MNGPSRSLVSRLFGIALCGAGLVAAPPYARYLAEQSPARLHHAFFRRPVTFDPGTVHLLIDNPGPVPVGVTEVALNDMVLSALPRDDALWWSVTPPRAAPGQTLDLAVKLRWGTSRLVRVRTTLSDGAVVEAVVEPTPPTLRLTSVAHSDTGRTYLYVANTGDTPQTLTGVLLDGRDVTAQCAISDVAVAPASKALIVYDGDAPPAGRHVTWAVETQAGQVAAATVRAWTRFPICDWSGDRSFDLGFDAADWRLPLLSAGPPPTEAPASLTPYHAGESPSDLDGEVQKVLGTQGMETADRVRQSFERDPGRPALVDVCYYRVPAAHFVYAELADVLLIRPLEMTYHLNPALADAEHVKAARDAAAPRPVWVAVEAFSTHLYNARRLPSAEEERLIVYSCLGEGAKGVVYYAAAPDELLDTGYGGDPLLLEEVGRINAELGTLRPWLAISDPFPLEVSTTAGDAVRAYPLLCGDQAIALLLANMNHRSRFQPPEALARDPDTFQDERWMRPGEEQFVHTPVDDCVVRVRLPEWLSATGVSSVDGAEMRPLPFTVEEREVIIQLGNLNVTRQVLVTTEARLNGLVGRSTSPAAAVETAAAPTHLSIEPLEGRPFALGDVESAEAALRALEEPGAASADPAELERLRAICYERMARYPEACAALARHAALVSAGDRRAAGRLLERKAAELARGGEIAGGIALYRLLIREHRDTRSAPRAHLAIAALLADHRTDVAGAIREYNRLLHDFPDSKEAELVPYELARWHITKEEVHRYGRAN